LFWIFLFCTLAVTISAQNQKNSQLPRPERLDDEISWRRDPATDELIDTFKSVGAKSGAKSSENSVALGDQTIRVVSRMVRVTCNVATAEGAAVPGLAQADFTILDNGVPQTISYFDASNEPASVALVIDASPSVLLDSEPMREAADALIDALAPLDQAAVVDFSAHTYLQMAFTDVHELVRRAVSRVDARTLLDDTGGSNIYRAVYLSARGLFGGRTGRKAIVLLTDGQDSGLGLTLDPASESPHPGDPDNRLTFDDVAKALAAQDIQLFAVSTERRPKLMTPEWLANHASATLVTPASREAGIPPYTLYLAELVRRAGGQLYFLHESATMADTFVQIARRIRSEYTLGYYPHLETSPLAPDAPDKAGFHELRVEVPARTDAVVSHRAGYDVSAAQ
jgi:Ca-activated chloride channel family protein